MVVTQLLSLHAHALYSFYIQDRPYLPCSVGITLQPPTHNSLSMHANMHYTLSTTHPTAFHNPGFHPYTCLFSISFCNLFQLFSQVLFQNIQNSLLIIVSGPSVEMTREKAAIFSDDLMYCSNHVSWRLNSDQTT